NSLMEEFEKPKVEFRDFENTLLTAIEKGRYTVPYEKQVVLTDEDGRSISREAKKRGLLPWILFDFDDTLHNLADSTFHIFQNIIKEYSGVEVAVDTIRETRQTLKEAGKYQYQDMLLSFIKQHNPESQVTSDEITKAYQVQKNLEPFIPKMSKEDFLNLRNKYRIGIITDGSEFPSKVPKMKEFYGVDIDGYVYGEAGVKKKPDLEMYKKFCKTYHVTDKPIAYVGDKKDLDGAMAINANLKFIKVDPTKPVLEIQKFNKELGNIEEQRKLARKNWGLLRGDVVVQRTTIQPAKKSFGVK
ncbi:MAG TPA: HAD family hydrolase, partial [Gammaproteobacteria bacterium]|nr:HAD family hydrolase [Gammaproteobacteria bacterium]